MTTNAKCGVKTDDCQLISTANLSYFCNMDFQLTSEFKPTGDQPEAIKQLVEGLQRGDTAQTLLGVTGSGKTFMLDHALKGFHNLNGSTISHAAKNVLNDSFYLIGYSMRRGQSKRRWVWLLY